MIQYCIEKGWRVPRFYCDVCQKPITNFRTAIVIFNCNWRRVKEGSYLGVLHVHTNKCKPVAYRNMRQALGVKSRLDWIGMSDHMADLLDNTDISLEHLAKSRERTLR